VPAPSHFHRSFCSISRSRAETEVPNSHRPAAWRGGNNNCSRALVGSNSNCSAHAGGRRQEAECGWHPRVDASVRRWISCMLTLVASSSSPCANAASILHLPLTTMAMLTPTCASPSHRLVGDHGCSPTTSLPASTEAHRRRRPYLDDGGLHDQEPRCRCDAGREAQKIR
jgi:hypothetical protein